MVLRQQEIHLRPGGPIFWLQLDINQGNVQVRMCSYSTTFPQASAACLLVVSMTAAVAVRS